MDKKRVLLYTVLGLIIVELLFFTLFPGMLHVFRDSVTGNAILSSNGDGNSIEDKCFPPTNSGYTEESWKEHMSHHPNIYAECLS